MTNTIQILDSIAAIFSYPGDDYSDRVARCKSLLAETKFERDDIRTTALEGLDRFHASTNGLSVAELEELYTRTFDINPVSSLEVGWHLHGETYERGAFLVTMRDVLRRCAVEESTELPDHLTHVLMAVGRMEEDEAQDFVSARLLKAIDKMLEGFSGKENPYEHVLTATRQILAEMCSHSREALNG